MVFEQHPLENYAYEMMKGQYHDLFITSRTPIQDPSIQPPGGNRSNAFYILEQGEYEGEEGFWVEDEEGLEGFMATNDEETFEFWRSSLQGRCLGEISGSKRGRKRKIKGSHQRGGVTPFRKSGSGGKATLANTNQDPYDQAYWGKGIGKKGTGKSKFQKPYDGNKGCPSYENGKGKGGHDKGKSKTFAATAENLEEQSANQRTVPSTEPTKAGWTDQDWDPSWNWSEPGWYSSMRHPAQDKQ